MLGKRLINSNSAAAGGSCTTDTVQILDGSPFQSISTYQLDGNANDLTTNSLTDIAPDTNSWVIPLFFECIYLSKSTFISSLAKSTLCCSRLS